MAVCLGHSHPEDGQTVELEGHLCPGSLALSAIAAGYVWGCSPEGVEN